MAKADVRIRVVRNDFPKDAVNVLRTSYRLSEDVADDVAILARRFVPVDTWFLHDSIEVLKKTGGAAGHYVNVWADYAVYVEYGTRYMNAQPFLTPAAEIVRSYMAAMAAKAFREALS